MSSKEPSPFGGLLGRCSLVAGPAGTGNTIPQQQQHPERKGKISGWEAIEEFGTSRSAISLALHGPARSHTQVHTHPEI